MLLSRGTLFFMLRQRNPWVTDAVEMVPGNSVPVTPANPQLDGDFGSFFLASCLSGQFDLPGKRYAANKDQSRGEDFSSSGVIRPGDAYVTGRHLSGHHLDLPLQLSNVAAQECQRVFKNAISACLSSTESSRPNLCPFTAYVLAP